MLTITGPMRSGTSIVARIAHQLGICMGTAMRIPPPGSGLDPEFEDIVLADELARDAMGLGKLYWYQLKDYIERRPFNSSGPWGFKSPLLALYWSEWLEAAEACGESVVTVRCARSFEEMEASLVSAARNEQERNALLALQCRIYKHLSPVLGYSSAVISFGTPPQQIAEKLASLMGIEHYDPEIAVRGIRT